MKALVLFSREDCHLCDRLVDALVPLIEGHATLEIVDIDADSELAERYGLRIPVLVGNGRELSGYPLDAERVKRFLAGRDG